METLRDFQGSETIELKGDLQVENHETVRICFEWTDREREIIFPKSPEGGRHFNLWQQTCFEAFVRFANGEYIEINLTTKGAWNVYRFNSYRAPQPPQEYPGANPLSFKIGSGKFEARLLIPGCDFSNIKVGLTAVLLLTSGRTTYWSLKHTAAKPDFHLSESFTLERGL